MRHVSVLDASRLLGVKRQTIQQAIKGGRLPAKKNSLGMYQILFDDLDKYVKSKWDRHETTKINGEKVFGKETGGLSVKDAAEILGVKRQHLYYAIRKGFIKKMLIGQVFLLREKDVYALKESEWWKSDSKNSSALAI